MTVKIPDPAERLRPAGLHRLIFRDQKPPFLQVIPFNRPVVAVVAHRILQKEDSISELVNMHNCERSEAIQRTAGRWMDCFVASLLAMTAVYPPEPPNTAAPHNSLTAMPSPLSN